MGRIFRLRGVLSHVPILGIHPASNRIERIRYGEKFLGADEGSYLSSVSLLPPILWDISKLAFLNKLLHLYSWYIAKFLAILETDFLYRYRSRIGKLQNRRDGRTIFSLEREAHHEQI